MSGLGNNNAKSGNKGSNYNFEFRLLSILADSIKAIQAQDLILENLVEQRTPTSVVTTGSYIIPIGASEISIFNNSTIDALVNGTSIPSGVTRTFGFKNPIDTSITCNGNGVSELIIDYMI